MNAEPTRVGKSSQQMPAIRLVDAILPEPKLRPLTPQGPAEEGTLLERRRAVAFWASSREAVRR